MGNRPRLTPKGGLAKESMSRSRVTGRISEAANSSSSPRPGGTKLKGVLGIRFDEGPTDVGLGVQMTGL